MPSFATRIALEQIQIGRMCPRGAGEQRVTILRRTRHMGRSDGGIRCHLVLDDDAAIEGGFETVANDASVPLPGGEADHDRDRTLRIRPSIRRWRKQRGTCDCEKADTAAYRPSTASYPFFPPDECAPVVTRWLPSSR